MTQSILRPDQPLLDEVSIDPGTILRGEETRAPDSPNGHPTKVTIRRWPDGSRTVQVGGHARLFGPPIDWRRWTEKRDRKQDGVSFGTGKSAIPWLLPAKVLCWHQLGPKQVALRKLATLDERLMKLEETLKIERKKYGLLREIKISALEELITGVKAEIRMVESEETTRKMFAARQSRQKRPPKVERLKSFRRKPKDEEKSEDGKSKGGKKKKKGKKKGGDGGEQKKGDNNKGGRNKGRRGGK